MAKGIRFDLAFAQKQIEKRKNWNRQGKRAGHGGSFDIDSPLAALTKSSGSLPTPPQSPSSSKAGGDSLGSDIPTWMIRAMETDSEVAYAATHKKVTAEQVQSPHKRRIGQGIKSEKERTSSQLKEHWLQVRIFYTLEIKYPSLFEVAFAVPNGGDRAARTASLMMYEGQKKGTPDICIPDPRGKYHGMFLEVKTEKGTASKEQKAKADLYRRRGYYVAIGKGFAQCHDEIAKYYNLPEFDNSTELAA
ncbi:VRR-NUC domain-containing protein [Vibrio metschnikovii]|uniref:VRR-NUC domain-containing protein n=1 Tax=Vibrio metschnikovii TaxID=28172 RepID=UPI001C301CAA|nr:VRR-NUC domain-containing protein [Vibrio metschnikovii]